MITIHTSITTGHEPLTVKELAPALGVSRHFVYQMRACGFIMEWNSECRCETATQAQARWWLKKTNFKLVRARGVIKG